MACHKNDGLEGLRVFRIEGFETLGFDVSDLGFGIVGVRA